MAAAEDKFPQHQHAWPDFGRHLFGPWMALTKERQYRQCVHPKCHHYEERPNQK